MTGVLKIAEQLLMNQIISNNFPLSGKTKAGLGLSCLSGLLIFTGLVFFIYAANLWLNNNFSADIAAALTGCVAFSFAAIISLIALSISQYKKIKAAKMKQEIQHTIMQAIEIANDEFSDPIKDNPKTAVTGAALTGFMLGNRFQ